MAKILVTGGAGFIGSKLVSYLLKENYSVTVIDDLSRGKLDWVPKEATFIHGCASQASTYVDIESKNFDCVIHLAGQSSGEISFENPQDDCIKNTLSTLNLLEFMRRNNLNKIIFSSSMSVYGDNNREAASETMDPSPKSIYAANKLASENFIKIFKDVYNVNYTILRYFNVYGPGQDLENLKQGMLSIYLAQAIKNHRIVIKGDLERFRDLIHVNDVVKITEMAIRDKNFNNQTINVGVGIKTTVKEMIDMIKDHTNLVDDYEVVDGTLGDQFGIISDNRKLRQLIDFNLITPSQGIKEMCDWSLNTI